MEFPSNSLEPSGPSKATEKADKPEKVIRKIATGSEAIKKKRTLGTRMRDLIVSRQGQSLSDFILGDVLGRVEEVITVIQAIERLTNGGDQQYSRRSSNYRGPVGSSSRVAYNRYSPRPEPRPSMSSRARASHDFGEIELQTRAQAEAVIAQMDEFIDRFGHTSVADLYEMVDLEAEYTDEKWGWTDLRGADVRRTRVGTYILILPRTEPIG